MNNGNVTNTPKDLNQAINLLNDEFHAELVESFKDTVLIDVMSITKQEGKPLHHWSEIYLSDEAVEFCTNELLTRVKLLVKCYRKYRGELPERFERKASGEDVTLWGGWEWMPDDDGVRFLEPA